MTNHHDEMRVAPDSSRADELRRRLHARLANSSRDEPVAPIQDALVSMPSVDADPDDRAGDIVMLEPEDRPKGGPPAVPRRRSTGRWLLVAAAAVVVAVVGTLLATGGDDDNKINTVTPTPTTTPAPARDAMRSPLEPGRRYFVDPDGDDATPLRVTFDVTTEGWLSWFGAVKYLPGNADGFTGLSITTVTNLVTDACRDHTALDPPVGPTVDDLAIALSQLAPFELTAPPTDVTLLGYQGKHLELTVPDVTVTGGGEGTASKNAARFTDCVEGELYSWISPINDDRSNTLLAHSPVGPTPGSFNAYQAPGQTEEFWILDVEGTRLVLVSFDTPLAPSADVAERDAIFDSIRIEPADQPSPAVTAPVTVSPRALFGTPGEHFVPGTYYVDEVEGTATPRIFVTLGDGWTNFGDKVIGRDGGGDARFSRADRVYADVCHASEGFHPGPVTSLDGLVTALTEQQGWADVTVPTDVTVNGYAGMRFQRTAPTDKIGCNTNDAPFRSWETDGVSGTDYFWYQQGEIETLLVLDLNGTIIVINTVTSDDREHPATAPLAAMLDSIRIEQA